MDDFQKPLYIEVITRPSIGNAETKQPSYIFLKKKFQDPTNGVVSVVNAGALGSTLGVYDM